MTEFNLGARDCLGNRPNATPHANCTQCMHIYEHLPYQSALRLGGPSLTTTSAPCRLSLALGPKLILGPVLSVSPGRLAAPGASANQSSAPTALPSLEATPLGFALDAHASLCTRRGGGGVLDRTRILSGSSDVVCLVVPSSPQGKYDVAGMLTGVCSGDPRTGVRGAISPSSFFRRLRRRGNSDRTGVRIDLTSEVDVCARVWRCDGVCPPLGVDKSMWPVAGDDGCDGEASGVSQTRQLLDLPKLGNALSFALKLRNRNSGTNQTQMAKNAATSMNAGPSLYAPAPYRYLGCRKRLASFAFAAKW